MGNAKQPERSVTVREARRHSAPGWPEELERLLDRAFFGPRLWRRLRPPSHELWREAAWMPDMDIFDRDGRTVVRVDLPGMKREDIDVAVEGDMLVIRGHREAEREIEEQNYYCAERASGEFSRALSLPEGTASESIDATYQDGVLEVVILKPAVAEAKAVKVQVK